MRKRSIRAFRALPLVLALLVAISGPGLAANPPLPSPGGDNALIKPGLQTLDNQLDDSAQGTLLALDNQFIANRTAGDNPLDITQAGLLRSQAANAARQLAHNAPSAGPTTFASPWSNIGPSPLEQIARSDGAGIFVSGRIGALAIRKDGTFILGAAQGGIWTMGPTDSSWTDRTDSLPSLATGALAVAPSNDLIVYDGTGEGALSGDSYFGNGILKSTDGGMTWSHVSGDFFVGVSVARLAVDPTNANHLYAAILRGRGGVRRVSPPIHSQFGIWESKDGGVSWNLVMAAPSTSLGATDIRLDPRKPTTLYSSFWGDQIYKSTDGGATWGPIMNGLPTNANFGAIPTRFSIGISHPASAATATLYVGFDYFDTANKFHPAAIFKSTDEGASWQALPTGTGPFDTVSGYCGVSAASTQCFYDNVVEPDPTNPNVVFVAGSFGYNMPIPSGGIFRSDDGGQTWKNLGWDLHPDFHALAFDPNNSQNVLIGNDGGVWFSPDQGGRQGSTDKPNDVPSLQSADFQNFDLNVGLDAGGNLVGLPITQFDSIATNPTRTARIWGGSQDNGTERKAAGSNLWFDLAGGDGGQVLVDPTDFHFVYGTFFNVSPYRFTDGGTTFFSNQFITNGLNRQDRSDFYMPFVLNQSNPNQLFLGTYRLYRTDNAKAQSAGDVKWNAISGDLTTGCTGPAPNGARNCTISAIGVGGGTGVYTGSLDGLIYFSPDAQVSLSPTWTLVGTHSSGTNDKHSLPNRPVSWIAVDRSNDRIAYAAFNGYSAATPHRPGHVFKTTDGGMSWTDISGNLPDSPVNSVLLDPTYPNTLYAGTDVGVLVTYNGGANWSQLGTGMPTVAVDELDMNPGQTPRLLAAATHGRAGWTLADSSAAVPALVLAGKDNGIPVGPGSSETYTLTVHNIGNAAATGVTVTDPIPANTSFVSAQDGGVMNAGVVTWSGLSIPAHASAAVHFTVQISSSATVSSITNDGYTASDAQGQSVSGSPIVTKFAPAFGLSLSPAAQTGGAHPNGSQTYGLTITNLGFKTDSYNLAVTGGTFPATILDSTCTTPESATASVAAGSSANLCVKVSVPSGTTDGTSSTSTVTATSVGSPTTSSTATIQTISVTVDTLLVDEDGNAPDVNSFYTTALTTAGVAFDTWDLNANPDLPLKYVEAFKNVLWFTGTSYPGPILPYEGTLSAYLDNGGHLFLSGQDILDQAAGTTPFVHNYLHVTWDGTENQNDRLTHTVAGVSGNPVSNSIGTIPLDLSVLGGPGAAFMDQITPIGGALPAFTDDGSSDNPPHIGPQPDALTFSGTYMVVFLAFPFEEYGGASDKATLVTDVISFFNS